MRKIKSATLIIMIVGLFSIIGPLWYEWHLRSDPEFLAAVERVRRTK